MRSNWWDVHIDGTWPYYKLQIIGLHWSWNILKLFDTVCKQYSHGLLLLLLSNQLRIYDSSYEGLWAICQCDLDRESVCMYVCVCMYVQASQWKEIWSLTNIYLLLHEDILFQAYVSELGNNFTQLTNAIIIEQYSFNMIDKVLTVEKKEKIH